jgi:hypothetical protein
MTTRALLPIGIPTRPPGLNTVPSGAPAREHPARQAQLGRSILAVVTDDSRAPAPPPAIRITRPYANEDDYLRGEIDTLTRTSITLLGAQQRPQAVVLRFEVVLPSGQALVRGEGRVVGFKPNAHHGLSGLTLRFTRLDSRSKALIDRAATIRERRRSSAPPAGGSEVQTALDAIPPPSHTRASEAPAKPADDERASPQAVISERRAEPPPPRASGERLVPIDPPPGRDALLERLRARAKTLDTDTVRQILAPRAARG